jgi:hypothetical protein
MSLLRLTALLKRFCAREDVTENAGRLTERPQHIGVAVDEVSAAQVRERVPIALLWKLDTTLFGHLDKEHEGKLLDIKA